MALAINSSRSGSGGGGRGVRLCSPMARGKSRSRLVAGEPAATHRLAQTDRARCLNQGGSRPAPEPAAPQRPEQDSGHPPNTPHL